MDLPLLRSALKSQYSAAIHTLLDVVDACDDALWTAQPPGTIAIWRIAHHTLWYTNLYASKDESHFRGWPGHRDDHQHIAPIFWEDNRAPTLGQPTTRQQMHEFADYVLRYVATSLADDDFTGPSGFPWLPFGRLEMHLYNMRHIQHHAAILSARVTSATGKAFRGFRAAESSFGVDQIPDSCRFGPHTA